METLRDIQLAIGKLPYEDRESLASWLQRLAHSGYRVEEPRPAYESALRHPYLSADEYLKFEKASAERHEYIDGVVYAMSGVSERHSVVAGNIFAAFHAHLSGGPCRVHVSDFKLRLEAGDDDIFYYPDVMVACGRAGVEDFFLRYPKLIVEVLSPSTEAIDRREKLLNYRQVSSVEEYVLAAQNRPQLVFHRREDRWRPRILDGLNAVAEFRSIGLQVPLTRIYDDFPG